MSRMRDINAWFVGFGKKFKGRILRNGEEQAAQPEPDVVEYV
jgi:hypothetical protein